MAVMLSAAKHLVFSVTYEEQILRLPPQDDIATQSHRGLCHNSRNGVFVPLMSFRALRHAQDKLREKSLFRPKREICLDPSHSLGMTTSYPGDHDTVCGGRARVSAVMLECGNVACILRVEEGAKKYDAKKNSVRRPDNLIFGCC